MIAERKKHSNKNINKVALEAFFNIGKLWKLTNAQEMNLLGLSNSSSTYYNWKKNKNGILSNDTLDRISYILGIFKSLRIIFEDKNQGYEWIMKENSAFNGKSALDILLQGKIVDLSRVRSYLDAQRGY